MLALVGDVCQARGYHPLILNKDVPCRDGSDHRLSKSSGSSATLASECDPPPPQVIMRPSGSSATLASECMMRIGMGMGIWIGLGSSATLASECMIMMRPSRGYGCGQSQGHSIPCSIRGYGCGQSQGHSIPCSIIRYIVSTRAMLSWGDNQGLARPKLEPVARPEHSVS